MSLTKEFKDTVLRRVKTDLEFKECLLSEAVNELLNGDPAVAKSMLRDFINSTISFKELSKLTAISDKGLMRMLSGSGNPTLESLSLIIKAIENYENIKFSVSIKHINMQKNKRLQNSKNA